ncbi:hypothetical protein ADK57_17700 [Streptomyces sp. MMG1533]|uniref:cytochrome P450 n=1 Tax=Streptomyces sp. MMG1533 TaxID=1415546 RepID=UPI0006AF6C4A|nr:cytochrome P450 [Streptomyces sp. MMG1533]KOU66819.1 hypothetical protein ADK57_17700 [Streptomyces sp. MMG1533]
MVGELGDLYGNWRAEHGPVVPVELDGGVPACLVIGHRAIQDVCRSEATYTSDSRHWSELRAGRVPADWPLLPQIAFQEGNARFMSGGPHRRLRGVVTSGLHQVDPAGTRRFVEWVADRLIDRFARTGRADVVADYAAPLPLLVMLRLVGMPHEAGENLLPAIFRLLEGGSEAQHANTEINALLDQLVAARRELPERDLVSWLIHGPVEAGPRLSDVEVRNLAWLTVMAGAGGTTGWIANVMEQFVRGEDLHSLYLGGRASIAEIMNETHRTNPAVQNVMGRFPLRDLPAGELGKYPIPRGTLLVLGLAGANADPAATGGDAAGAHHLSNEYHFAFGAGPHECPSAAQRLAHIIAQSAIERFLVRCRGPQLEDAQAVRWGGSVIVRQLQSMRVTFTPGEAVARPDAAGTALGDASRSSHSLFPPRMRTALTAHGDR